MRKSKINAILWIAVLLVATSPSAGEKISFKLSYNTASVSSGDLNTWIDSYNTFWNDWSAHNNGQLNGQLDPLNYGPKYEVELRIPIIMGLAFNLSGSHFTSTSEGAFDHVYGTHNNSETHSIKNEIKGFPIKIGFSYSFSLPFMKNLYLFTGVGRHITFLKYNFFQDYVVINNNYNVTETLINDYSYNSEALGVYITLGLEYDLIKHIALVIEAEQVWSKADGFKGPYKYEKMFILGDPYYEAQEITEGKASMYFYEYREEWSSAYYSSLAGHKKKPEDPKDISPRTVDFQNLRQGEIDLSTFSFKIGIRFKF